MDDRSMTSTRFVDVRSSCVNWNYVFAGLKILGIDSKYF